MSDVQRFFLESLGAKRFHNATQRHAVAELERIYGPDKLHEAITWAAEKGMSMGNAVSALKQALPKWGKPKPGRNGRRPDNDEIHAGYDVPDGYEGVVKH